MIWVHVGRPRVVRVGLILTVLHGLAHGAARAEALGDVVAEVVVAAREVSKKSIKIARLLDTAIKTTHAECQPLGRVHGGRW